MCDRQATRVLVLKLSRPKLTRLPKSATDVTRVASAGERGRSGRANLSLHRFGPVRRTSSSALRGPGRQSGRVSGCLRDSTGMGVAEPSPGSGRSQRSASPARCAQAGLAQARRRTHRPERWAGRFRSLRLVPDTALRVPAIRRPPLRDRTRRSRRCGVIVAVIGRPAFPVATRDIVRTRPFLGYQSHQDTAFDGRLVRNLRRQSLQLGVLASPSDGFGLSFRQLSACATTPQTARRASGRCREPPCARTSTDHVGCH